MLSCSRSEIRVIYVDSLLHYRSLSYASVFSFFRYQIIFILYFAVENYAYTSLSLGLGLYRRDKLELSSQVQTMKDAI